MESVKKDKKPNVDRISISPLDSERLDVWIEQINSHFEGLVRANKSDIISSLIRGHSEQLSVVEVSAIASELYDELQWTSRAVEMVKQARRDGKVLLLDALMAKRLPLTRIRQAQGSKGVSKISRENSDSKNKVEAKLVEPSRK